MLGWIIAILLCIGALYQWRHTDFVKAILVVLAIGAWVAAVSMFGPPIVIGTLIIVLAGLIGDALIQVIDRIRRRHT